MYMPYTLGTVNTYINSKTPCHCKIRDFEENTIVMATETWRNKGSVRRTIALHVRFQTLYISWPSEAKQRGFMKIFALSENENLASEIIHVSFRN